MTDYYAVTEQAKKFIGQNIGDVTPESVSQRCNYSKKQLSRIFEMVTGATLGEYLRWARLSRALYEIKHTDDPILDIALKYKYESQEAFTRIFKEIFGVTPGECRKSAVSIDIRGNSHLQKIIEGISHEAVGQDLYSKHNVKVLHVTKPARIWISSVINSEKMAPHSFYDYCEEKGYMRKASALKDVINFCGAYLTMAYPEAGYGCLSWGAEAQADYNTDALKEFEVFNVPESEYVVFNAMMHPIEEHGSIIKSTWDMAQTHYNYAGHNLALNTDSAPIYEDVNADFGYTLWFSVKKITTEKQNTFKVG